MKRDSWEFEYTASKLAEGAKKKAEMHKAKLAWWEAKKAETMDKVRASGIEVHDSVAASYSNTKGGYGPQITIDPMLQRDLVECQNKILEHNSFMEIYNGWVSVLEAHPESRLKVTSDDWLFFFGEMTYSR